VIGHDVIQHTPIASYINFKQKPRESCSDDDSLILKLYKWVDDLDNLSSFERSMTTGIKVGVLRNARQTHFGYTGNHSTVIISTGTSSPNLVQNLDDRQRNKFVTMTKIGHLLFDSRKENYHPVSGSFFSDGGMREEMARLIHPDNLVHSRTESVNHYGLIGIHCDINNDGTDEGRNANLNVTLVVHDAVMNTDGTISSS
jgi:hypothetical protein